MSIILKRESAAYWDCCPCFVIPDEIIFNYRVTRSSTLVNNEPADNGINRVIKYFMTETIETASSLSDSYYGFTLENSYAGTGEYNVGFELTGSEDRINIGSNISFIILDNRMVADVTYEGAEEGVLTMFQFDPTCIEDLPNGVNKTLNFSRMITTNGVGSPFVESINHFSEAPVNAIEACEEKEYGAIQSNTGGGLLSVSEMPIILSDTTVSENVFQVGNNKFQKYVGLPMQSLRGEALMPVHYDAPVSVQVDRKVNSFTLLKYEHAHNALLSKLNLSVWEDSYASISLKTIVTNFNSTSSGGIANWFNEIRHSDSGSASVNYLEFFISNPTDTDYKIEFDMIAFRNGEELHNEQYSEILRAGEDTDIENMRDLFIANASNLAPPGETTEGVDHRMRIEYRNLRVVSV